MSRLSELIAELCPDGVEYRALGEVAELVRGSGLQKKDFSETGVGCIHYGQIHTKFGSYTDQVLSYVPEELAKKLTVIHPGDVVVAVTSEDVSACCKAVAWIGDVDVVTGGHCVVMRHDLDSKYLSYCFQTNEFYVQKKRFAAGVKVTEMRTDKLARIRIPVPPIEVQREVVRILDEYTAAHDELIRRLHEEMRLCEQQLAMTRNKLLTFSERERVKWATLGELCRIGRGTYITRKEIIPGAVPVILGGMKPAYYHNVSNHEGEAIVVSRSGVNAGYASFWDQPIFVSDGFIIDGSVDGVLLSYVYEVMRSRQKEMIAMNRGSGVPHITGKMLSALRIPVPSVASQKELISTLVGLSTKHKTLIHEISLEESYRNGSLSLVRNHLLSFPEKGA